MKGEYAYRARWIYPVDGDPLPDATFIITDGVVSEITTVHVPNAVDMGSAAIIPGLVNAHVDDHCSFFHLLYHSLGNHHRGSIPATYGSYSHIAATQCF